MNSPSLPPILGNICVGLAALVFVLPLHHLLSEYSRRYLNNDEWVPPALAVLIPLWLLLMGALLCMTAVGGFDWLRLGRSALYALTVAATVALAVVSFVSVAFYMRPGFTPRMLYYPVICLVPVSTMLLVVLSLNPRLTPGLSTAWLRVPWTLFAALSLVACVVFFGHRMVRGGMGAVAGIAHRISNPGPSSGEVLAQIAVLDPEKDFESLISRASRPNTREIRDAALARLRSHSNFVDRLSAELESGHVEPAVTFLRDARLSAAEKARLARPACSAMERWVHRIPAPNYTTKKHLKELRAWGTEMFRGLAEEFSGADVDFGPVLADFKEKVEATR